MYNTQDLVINFNFKSLLFILKDGRYFQNVNFKLLHFKSVLEKSKRQTFTFLKFSLKI